MKGYDRKKYITKLLYIYMLGYEIEFGHMEAIELLSSSKYSEKHLVSFVSSNCSKRVIWRLHYFLMKVTTF
jgi:hypothetical protein